VGPREWSKKGQPGVQDGTRRGQEGTRRGQSVVTKEVASGWKRYDQDGVQGGGKVGDKRGWQADGKQRAKK
jgi:hypothetical protein